MAHQSTIAEHIGAKKHSFIPHHKRGGSRVRDAEGKVSMILRWVKDHEGLPTDVHEVAADLELNEHTVRVYLGNLKRAGKITRERSGVKSVYRLGTQGGPRNNGTSVITKPAAPFSLGQIDILEHETFQFIKAEMNDSLSNESIGAFVRGMVGLSEKLRSRVQ